MRPLHSPTPANDREKTPQLAPALALLPDAPRLDSPESSIAIGGSPDRRIVSIYEPMAAFELVEELDFLTDRSLEPNAFFTPQFLIPAMPRLDERHVRLLIARDEDERRSRLRLLMPFSVERAGLFFGPRTVRAWSHPFGPVGTLPVDGDDPSGTLESLLSTLVAPQFKLPPILVLPDQRLDGPVVNRLMRRAEAAGLPSLVVDRRSRAALVANRGGSFRAKNLSAKQRREFARQRRMLERDGPVRIECAVAPAAVRDAVEEFLSLEASGWKGRARSAMLLDRYRAAFAREAMNGLAEAGRVRVFTLRVGASAVASLIVLVVKGEATLWKTAYDERHAAASPGFQIIVEASEALMADPGVRHVDSCAVPGHSLMERLWPDRVSIGTIVVGLRPGDIGGVARAAKGLTRLSSARYRAWQARRAVARLITRR